MFVVTRGFLGTVALVVTAGYTAQSAAAPAIDIAIVSTINRTASEIATINRTAALIATINSAATEQANINRTVSLTTNINRTVTDSTRLT